MTPMRSIIARVLWVLHSEPWLSVRELSDLLGVNPACVDSAVRNLFKCGMLRREKDLRALVRGDGIKLMVNIYTYAVSKYERE